MSGYRVGLQGPILDYVMKKYRGYRSIPGNIVYEEIRAQFEDSSIVKKEKSVPKSYNI